MGWDSKMLENELKEKRDSERIIEQAKYRVNMKRKLRKAGFPSCVVTNASTESLETLCGLV